MNLDNMFDGFYLKASEQVVQLNFYQNLQIKVLKYIKSEFVQITFL